MSETSIATSLLEVRDQAKLETLGGGTLGPCPFCGVARHQRTCYVRCNVCSLNWEAGSDLSVHPRVSQVAKVLAK